jgi:hypothetical protein
MSFCPKLFFACVLAVGAGYHVAGFNSCDVLRYVEIGLLISLAAWLVKSLTTSK